MNLGIIHGEPMDTYQSSPAISGGKLKAFTENFPAYFHARYITKTLPDKDSAAFAFGRYYHALALEGQAVADAGFAISPGFDRRTTAGKQAFAAFQEANAGKEVVTQDDADLAALMLANLKANPVAVELLKQGAPEVTFRNTKNPALPMQTRPDWFSAEPCRYTDGFSYVVNLKTCSSMMDFEREAQKFGYFVAEAFCRAVIADTREPDARPTRHFFVVCDKEFPHGCGVFECDEITMFAARKVVSEQIAALLKCITKNEWPSGPVGVATASAPGWWLKENEPSTE